MPESAEDDDLLEVPSPAEQARVRGAIKSNFELRNQLDTSRGLFDGSSIKRVSLESGLAGILAAAGPRKGKHVSLESGSAGIMAAAGRKRGDYIPLELGAAGMIAQNRAYRAKKRNAGALAGARYGSPEMFPGKFPYIVGGPVSVGFGRSAGGVNLNILAAGQRGFANLT